MKKIIKYRVSLSCYTTNMIKEIKYLVPEMEVINVESKKYKNKLKLSGKDSHGKAFEVICHNWICNKEIADFNNDDTDGGDEFGIDSISIEETENGGLSLRILSCKYSKGFSYQQVDEIGKGLKIIFDKDNYEKLKNEKLKNKIKIIRENKMKVEEVKIYYCVNNFICLEDDDECLKSRNELLKELKSIFAAKYRKEINFDFLFFDSKSLYEKKIRNDNPLSKVDDIYIKYQDSINHFNKNKEINFNGGRIEGCVITVAATELKLLLEKCGDPIFNYNIRKYKGRILINKNIESTINSKTKNIFWFLNNGITLVCEQAIEGKTGEIKLRYPQVVNGQQTLKTISSFSDDELLNVDVLVRLYITDNEKFFTDIALATNSQTRIDFSDISSNKSEQQAIKYLFEQFGYYYKNKKGIEKKIFKIGVDSKTLGRISLSTINKRPSEGRKMIKDSDIFNEKNYNYLFNRNPHLLLLSFLIYNYCKKQDVGNKNIKRMTVEREIKHFGYFHLSALIWKYLEDEKLSKIKTGDYKQLLDLIEKQDFYSYYKKAFVKIKNVIKKKKTSRKSINLKDYFNDANLTKLIFKK